MPAGNTILTETLSPLDERICRLLAASELTLDGVAAAARCGRATVARRLHEPRIRARIAALRDDLRTAAMEDAAFADKRARVIALDAVARATLATLRETNFEETYYFGADALEGKRFDAGRVAALRQYLADIAAELDTARGPGTQVGVAVKIYVDPRMEQPLEADWDDAPPPNNRPPPD